MIKMQSNGNEAALSIRDKFSRLSRAQTQRSIYKVHEQLRNINNKAYEPEMVAIGPYHHGKDSFKMMEEHKLRYLESLLLRKNQNVETYVSAIGKMEQEARNCYAEPIGMNAAEFIEMLVLDGCFIIELLRKYDMMELRCRDDPIFQMNWIIIGLQRDLILFENQIPFFVLCELYDLIEAPNQPNRLTLIYLILLFFQDLFPGLSSGLYPGAVYIESVDISPDVVKHLLGLIYGKWCLHCPSNDDDASIHICGKWCLHCSSNDDDASIHICDDVSTMDRELRFIHSATELREGNVEFQMRKSGTLFGIDFKKGLKGLMLMPPLTVEDRTECLFRNLIAYEQYFLNGQAAFVTDYVILMDCLINSSRDVKILSQCGIIDNWLGDNEVVANIFNRLGDSVAGPGVKFVYAKTFYHINTHYKKRRNRAVAALRRDYFNSPWAYISFFAALVLLLLTVAQTVFSVLQVV